MIIADTGFWIALADKKDKHPRPLPRRRRITCAMEKIWRFGQ